MQNSLIISDCSIRKDAEGRFCLNDLHKAAGNQSKHQPANWLRLEQTKALITVIERSSDLRNAIKIMQGGRSQGTFVVKQMVYAYTMWISPEFQLQVINAYDSLVTNQTFDFLKPISEPLSTADFEWRYQVISKALNNLKNAQVIIKLSGAEFLAGK